MRRYVTIIIILLAVAAMCVSCSSKKKVVTGTQYKCKECGKIYRDDTREIEVHRSVAEEVGVEVVEGYCPKCGDETVTIAQLQHLKCPVCGASRGDVTKEIQIERKLSDTVPRELEVPSPCETGKCGRVGRLHGKYNWDWQICAAIADQGIDYGFNKDMVREAWGPPKRVEKVGNAERWYYEAGYVTIGASGKVVEIKQ
jgi:Zn finger protein HypA/HybF involved in hydrogenase expression